MRKALKGGVAPTGLTVFGDAMLDAAEVNRVREELKGENDMFEKIIAKADKKDRDKEAQAQALGRREGAALKSSQLTPKKRKAIATQLRNCRDRLKGNFYMGNAASRVDSPRLQNMLGGEPLVYVDSVDHLEGRGLAEPMRDGKTLHSYCFFFQKEA